MYNFRNFIFLGGEYTGTSNPNPKPKSKTTKNGINRRTRLPNPQRQYVRGIIHNLSMQRWTSQEIADYLREEKGYDIARITVNQIRNRVDKEAAKWYIELKKSAHVYIAAYKERLDSLFTYQKKLHEILTQSEKDEVKIKAISELHGIEMDIFNLWKQLPNLDVTEPEEKKEEKQIEIDTNGTILDERDLNGREEKPNEIESEAWAKAQDIGETWTQCPYSCKRWFRKHAISYHMKTCSQLCDL